MYRNPPLEIVPASIVLTEWDHIEPADNPRLKGTSFKDNFAAQKLAASLRDRVDIREGWTRDREHVVCRAN